MFSLQFAKGVRLNGPFLLDDIEPIIIDQCLAIHKKESVMH